MGSCVKYDPRYSLQTSHEFFCEGTQRRFVRHEKNIFLEMRVPAFLFRTMQSKEQKQLKERVVFILRCITQDVGGREKSSALNDRPFRTCSQFIALPPPFFLRLNNFPLPQFVNSSLPPLSAPSSPPSAKDNCRKSQHFGRKIKPCSLCPMGHKDGG